MNIRSADTRGPDGACQDRHADGAPDIETASEDYASRFAGKAGGYLLAVQDKSIKGVLGGELAGEIAEVGGGHGQLRPLYRDLGVSFVIHGSDEICFSRLGPTLKNERRVVSDLRDLPFADASVNTVIAVRLLCHLDDWQRVLREMCRVARDRVVFDFPTSRSLNGLTPLLFRLKKGVEKNTRTYTNFVARDFTKILAEEGFVIERQYRQFFFPMVIHRVLHGSWLSRLAESLVRVLGLTRVAGSPVVLAARRNRDAGAPGSVDRTGNANA